MVIERTPRPPTPP